MTLPAAQLPDVRRAFWTAALCAILYFGTAFANPVVGLVYSAIFAVAAIGIRRAQSWAAITAAVILLAPIAGALFHATYSKGVLMQDFAANAIGVCLVLLATVLFIRAARTLWTGAALSPWAVFLGLAATAFFTCRPLVNSTTSMADTILDGDQMFVNTFDHSVHRGDLVVFEYPIDRKNIFVKRVVAIGGDRIHLENKKLFLNGSPVDEPWARNETSIIDYYRDNFPRAPSGHIFAPAEEMLHSNFREGDILVPAGKFFVLGDNRDCSLDSRYWGFLAQSDIIGKPAIIYASFDNNRGQPSNIFTTRWERLLKRL